MFKEEASLVSTAIDSLPENDDELKMFRRKVSIEHIYIMQMKCSIKMYVYAEVPMWV